MMTLDEKVELASSTIEWKNIQNNKNPLCTQKIYPFTTENLKGELDPFDLTGKDVLTVMGSGDQVFEHFLKGAKNIDTFDLNPLSEPYFYLKLALLEGNMSKNGFFEFLCNQELYPLTGLNISTFDQEIYQRISPMLRKNYDRFWNQLLQRYSAKKVRLEPNLFTWDEERYAVLEQILNYAGEENYLKLQSSITNLSISFLNVSLQKLPYKLNKKYDFINLSNIIRYADEMWEENPLQEFKKVTDSLIPFLKEGGFLIVGYLYEYQTNSYQSIHQLDLREKYYPSTIYDYYQFKGVGSIKYGYNDKYKDAIIVYQKSKKL